MRDNVKHLKTQESRLDLAADFAVRIHSGTMSAEEQTGLEQWLQQDPQNPVELQAVLDVWHNLGALASRKAELQALPTRQIWRWAGLAVAASCILAVSLALLLPLNQQAPAPTAPRLASYETAIGQQQTIALDDGSQVTLNTDTRLVVDFSGTARRVSLHRGEAFFNVVPDAGRPFTIATGARGVTVLGTRFNLMKDGLDLNVAVVEGVVAVHRVEDKVTPVTAAINLDASQTTAAGQGNKYRLTAGAEARFSGYLGQPDAVVQVRKIAPASQYPSWTYGVISFDKQRLVEVIKEFNRYVKKKILIEDSTIMDMKISGVFRLDAIDTALGQMESAFPVQVREYSDRVVIVGK